MHKHVDAEGRTTFGDQPAEPAAVLVREGSRFLSYRRSAQIDASEASLRLVRAQFALERAAAPVQDDDHASRARYVQRQAALQRVVDQAQLRVDETHAAAPLPRGAR